MQKVISLTVVLTFCLLTALWAQNGDKDEPVRNPDGSYSTSKYNEAERPDDSYIAKFQAQSVVERLMKRNFDTILLLRVISENFPEKGWTEDFNNCFEGYKRAMAYYYQRNMIYARKELETNTRDIRALLKKVADDYEKDSKTILEECIQQVLALHFNERVKADPAKSRELLNNQVRLRIGFGQLDNGSFSSMTMNYELAIYHFRMAKAYGIKILEETAKPEERDSIRAKYQTQIADNMNRIFDKSRASN